MRIIYLTISGLFMSGIVLAGCHRESNDISLSTSLMESDSIPAKVKTLAKVMADNDSDGFSQLVSYPLQRPYPLKDVPDKGAMKEYYGVMVDDSLRRKIAGSVPEDWSENGWRGWTLEDGRYIWLDDSLYDVTYLSTKERALMKDLIEKEKATLPSEVGNGWIPEWCMEDPSDGTIYRIDADSLLKMEEGNELADGTVVYRLAVYDKGKDLHRFPKRMLKGRRRSEGTAGDPSYYFDSLRPDSADDNSEIVISPFSPENGQPRVFTGRGASERQLRKVYWLDVIKVKK